MNDYWSDHPPVHILVASYMGIKPATKKIADIRDLFGGDAAEIEIIDG